MWLRDNKLYTESEIRSQYLNTSFATPFNPADLGFVLVFTTPAPAVSELQVAYQDGTEIDAKGNIVVKWSIKDMFTTYVDIDGVEHTKEQQEQEYLNKKHKETVPLSVSMRQARLALLSVGLLDGIEAAMSSADKAVQIEWEYATIVERTSPLVTAMGTTLGMDDTAIDGLFMEASKL